MIMNHKNPIYGTVTQADMKNSYTGVTTDTAHVTVDNLEQTIAVDVDFRSMLGETADKAYPGNLGVQTRKLVVSAYEASQAQGQELIAAEKRIRRELYTEIREADTAIAAARADIETESTRAQEAESSLKQRVALVENTYADKNFVIHSIAESSKLSKQIVDRVDLVANKVIIDGEQKSPVDGVLYLVKDESQTGEDTYKQYTTVNGILTLIGDTKIDLSDYATLDYVNQQIDAIPEVDLTDYAKKSDIPDVSTFLSAIPEEYLTDTELDVVLDDYATKSYVAAELSKVGTLTKKIVEGIDVVNNNVLIDGVLHPAEPDIIYLVADETEGIYQQYTLIDNELTFIGDTNVDLRGYATEVYVDNKISEVTEYTDLRVSQTESNLLNILQNIKFIDGGTSSSTML